MVQSNIYAGKGIWYVLLCLSLVGVAMVTTWGGVPVPHMGNYSGAQVRPEYSGSRGDFECLPDNESEIWQLFEDSPQALKAAINQLEMGDRRMFN